MSIDDNLAYALGEYPAGFNGRDPHLPEASSPSKLSAATVTSLATVNEGVVYHSPTSPFANPAFVSTFTPIHVATTPEKHPINTTNLGHPSPPIDEPFIDDEPYIDDGLNQEDAFGHRVQHWLTQQCRFSLVFGESEQQVLPGLHGHLGGGKGQERSISERDLVDDEEMGVDGMGRLKHQLSFVSSLETPGSTPAATTATTTVTRTSSGSSRQQGSIENPTFPNQQEDRADSPLLGFESGPGPASDDGALDMESVDPLTRPAHNYVRDLPFHDGAVSNEWSRFAVRLRGHPSKESVGGSREKPLPMLPPASTRTSPVPTEIIQNVVPIITTPFLHTEQDRTPSGHPSPLPTSSSLLQPRPSLYNHNSTSPPRSMSSLRSSNIPSMQSSPLPASSGPTRRQSRAALSMYMTPVDFGDDYNLEQSQNLSDIALGAAGDRNTVIANTNTNGSLNTPNAPPLAATRSRSGSVGLRNAMYINSEEVIERLDALLLRSPTETPQKVEDELEDMAIEMEEERSGRKTPAQASQVEDAQLADEHDDGDSCDSKSEGRLEAEEILGELGDLGLGLKGLGDDRLHVMPAVATEAELLLMVQPDEELELFKPQPLDTLHENETDAEAANVTRGVIAATDIATAGPAVAPAVLPVTRSRTSSISLAAAGRVATGPTPAMLVIKHSRENSSTSSSRRVSPTSPSPSSRLSRSHSQSFSQPLPAAYAAAAPQHIQHGHSFSHMGFSRAGTPSTPSSRSNSNHGHGAPGNHGMNAPGHSSNYSNGSIVIPGVGSNGYGHSRSSSSVLLATPLTPLIHIALPVALPPAGAPRPTRPPPAPPLDLGPVLDDHAGALSLDSASLGLDIVSDEFYGDVLGSEESSQQPYRSYQDAKRDSDISIDGITAVYRATHARYRAKLAEETAGMEAAQRVSTYYPDQTYGGIQFPSTASTREEEEGPYGGLVDEYEHDPSLPKDIERDLIDARGEMEGYIEAIAPAYDPGLATHQERPSMQRSMSRWSLTSSTMGDDTAKEKKEKEKDVKKKKSRKSFSSPFAADTPSTPGVQDGNDGSSTPNDTNTSTGPAPGEKKMKRGRLASFISRLSGVSPGNGSPNHSGPTTPSTSIPPVPSLPPTPGPYAYGVPDMGFGMELSDLVLPKPPLRQGALMPSPDISDSTPKKLNAKSSRDLLQLQQSRQRSTSAADLLRKVPGVPKQSSPTTQSTFGSSSNIQQFINAHPPEVIINAPPTLSYHSVTDRRPNLVKSMSTPAIGPSAQRSNLQSRKPPIQIQTHMPMHKRSRPTILFDESMPPTPSTIASMDMNEEAEYASHREEEEEEDYGVETNELERIRRETEHNERWAAQMHATSPVEPAPPTPPTVLVSPPTSKINMLGLLGSHGHVLDHPSSSTNLVSAFDQRRRLRSMSNLGAAAQGMSKSPPPSASTANFTLPPMSTAPQKSGKGFRGFVERMGLGGSNSNSSTNISSSILTSTTLSLSNDVSSPPPSAGLSHSPTTSLSLGVGQKDTAGFSAGGMLGKKQPKRKLAISGVALSDTEGYEAVKVWCNNFGPIREITRANNGCVYVDFESASTAETVCRVQAQVFIKGAGSVQLSWYTGKRPL